ncbi:unnamed protein product [Blepharisma stoltei]|uniref:Replication protein A subunit n=1 Tax=Blepharisma stoltei TaxID=1481888 RepID=A0AAU9K2D4_9CILI|nr:unnamed protein product [Blepharisma stoltei]
MSLHPNAIRNLHNTQHLPDYQPIVQVLDMKSLNNQKYQIVISDGEFYQQALFVGQCNDIIKSGIIHIYDLIKINDYVVNILNNTKILFITEIEHVSSYDSQIADPIRYNDIRTNPKPVLEETQEIPEAPVPDQKIAQIPEKLIPEQTKDLYAPIKSLTPLSTSWIIKARVSQKTDIKTWHNARGEGKVFSITLIDSYLDEIQAVFFNAAADKFYDVFKEGKVYTFSDGNVRSAKRKFHSVENDYQLNFDTNAVIAEVPDDGNIGFLKFNFIPIDQLSKLEIGTILDVCGIITEIGSLSDIMSRKGENLKKRSVRITDHTYFSIEITLWNDLATLQDFDSISIDSKPILAGKSLRLTDFNGLSLTCEKSISSIYINPKDYKELDFIKRWKNSSTENRLQLTPLTHRTISKTQQEFKTLREIKEIWEGLMISSDQTISYTIIGYISYIRSDNFSSLTYPSCKNSSSCKKKVLMESDGLFRCEKCKESFPNCTYRYLLSMVFNDSTENINVTGFDEVGNSLFGMTAGQLYEVSKEQEKFDGVISGVFRKERIGTLRVSNNDSGNGPRTRYVLMKLEPMNFQRGSILFLDEINYIMGQISL